MKKTTAVVASCVALMSCGSGESTGINSFVTSPDRFADTGEVAAIPTDTQRYNETARGERFAGQNEVTSITYDSATETLTIAGDPFDSAGTFKRAPKRDVRGFAAFENEAGFRDYLALVRVDADHNLAAGVVGTPFRLDNEFGGTVLARGAAPTLPTNREVRHIGDYAGVRNEGTNVGDDMSNSFLHRVEGRVQLDLDFFTDRQSAGIEGVITNRRNMDGTTTREVQVDVPVVGRPGQTSTETRQIAEEITYADIVLQFTGIDENGNFSGIAVGGGERGLYDGMIAGNNAAASAGIVVIQDTSGMPLERGAFIARATD